MTVQMSTLVNGLRVVTDTMQDAESAVVGAWVGVGTRHEPWSANGVAHLVEHMMFKGTKKRSAYRLSAAIEKNGGSMNAHTTREETAYYARILPEHVPQAVDIIADMLQKSVFQAKELAREKKVIIQEIGRDLDSPEDHIFDLIYRLAYPKQKMGRPILGSEKTIAALPRRVALGYVQQHYHAGNMVIVGAGKITHAQLVKLAEKHFGKLPRGKAPSKEKARITSGAKLAPKPIEQLHILLGFNGPGYRSKDFYTAQLLSMILGGSSSSRLFQKVREKRGLVYTVHSSHVAYSDTGLFQIYAGTDPARAGELTPVVCKELRDVMRRITPGELKLAKAQIRAEILMGQENVMRRADVLGHQILAFGRVIPPQHAIQHIMKTTKKDVQALAKRLFGQRPILTALGPTDQLEDYKKIAARLKGSTSAR